MSIAGHPGTHKPNSGLEMQPLRSSFLVSSTYAILQRSPVEDTKGCILVGKRSEEDSSKLTDSKKAIEKITNNIQSGDTITVKISE